MALHTSSAGGFLSLEREAVFIESPFCSPQMNQSVYFSKALPVLHISPQFLGNVSLEGTPQDNALAFLHALTDKAPLV